MKPVERPGMTVIATTGARYDANAITVTTHAGRYVLSFLCSGDLVFLPVDEIAGIKFHKRGLDYCLTCDERLRSWPSNDRSYGAFGDEAPSPATFPQADGDGGEA